LDLDDGLPILRLGRDNLLWSGRQLATPIRQSAQALNSAHHVCLLSKESISQVGAPADVQIQFRHDIRKDHQRLYAGVPVLLPCSIDEAATLQRVVFLEPLLSFHKFQWIGAGHQYLREQWVRIECDWRYQVVELLRRQYLRSWLLR
jgi:hypothetical protein